MHRIDGVGATVNNLFTEGNPPATPATVVTDDWLNDVQEAIANVIEAAGITLVKGTQTQLLSAIRAISRGASSYIDWNDDNVDAPIKSYENNLPVYEFQDAQSQKLVALIKLGSQFQAGAQMKLGLSHYSASTSNGYVFRTTTTLIRNGTDALSSTTNQHVSSQAIVNAASSEKLRTTLHDLMDSGGQINSVSPEANDILIVELDRDTSNGSDTDSATVKLLAQGSEVRVA